MSYQTEKNKGLALLNSSAIGRRPVLRDSTGFSLIEIVVGVSILAVLFLAIASHFESALRATTHTVRATKAGYLVEEGVETVKLLREESWEENIATLANSSPYHLSFTGTNWVATTTPQVIDDTFSRTFMLEDVHRDGNGDIPGRDMITVGNFDPGTKKLTVTVQWESRNGTETKQLVTYIMNIYND